MRVLDGVSGAGMKLGIKILWDYNLTKAERKGWLHALKADLQNGIEEIKKQYPEVADLQTPNAENKSFDKLMPADQQTLLALFKAIFQENHTFPEGAYEDRKDKEDKQYLYGKLIPRQRTDDEIKKDAERIQQDPADEFEPTGKEACELIMTHDSLNIHGNGTFASSTMPSVELRPKVAMELMYPTFFIPSSKATFITFAVPSMLTFFNKSASTA